MKRLRIARPRFLPTIGFLLFFLFFGIHGLLEARARRVVLIVIDQCQAGYLDRFEVPHLRALRSRGLWFDQARVGHLASETVVSHPVLATGRLPRNLPWADEAFRDVDGILGPPGEVYLTGYLDGPVLRRLMARHLGPTDLSAVLRGATGGRTYALGSKSYATWTFGGSSANVVVTFGGMIREGPWAGWRAPTGIGLWEDLTRVGGRFTVDGRPRFGTEHLGYPVKGHRYVEGNDPEHRGGDVWVADLAVEAMDHDPGWAALFLTLAGVDKAGHLFGVRNPDHNIGQDASLSLRSQVHAADRAVGTVLSALRERGLEEETLVVLTSDHGAQSGRFLGARGPGRASTNWYFGVARNATLEDPSPELAPLHATGHVTVGVCDGMLRIWLEDSGDESARAEVIDLMKQVKGVIEVLQRGPEGYATVWEVDPEVDPFLSRIPSERRVRLLSWRREHGDTLLSTMAAPGSADLVGLLDDWTTYGARGDHGGHQEGSQRIPLILAGPGIPAGAVDSRPARLVDVSATIAELITGRVPEGFDGRALIRLPRGERRGRCRRAKGRRRGRDRTHGVDGARPRRWRHGH